MIVFWVMENGLSRDKYALKSNNLNQDLIIFDS
jgi:hypothetical protein